MSYAEQFETKTGADFAVFSEQAKVVWLIDKREPGRLVKLGVHSCPHEVCCEIDEGWPGYTIVHRDAAGHWEELRKIGGKLQDEPVRFLGFYPWTGKVPTESEVAHWFKARADREQANLLSAHNAALLLTCAMRLVNDISAGRHSGERSTTELSANVLGTVSEALADLDWTNVEAMKVARKRIKELCDSEPDLMRSYEALWAFGEGAYHV